MSKQKATTDMTISKGKESAENIHNVHKFTENSTQTLESDFQDAFLICEEAIKLTKDDAGACLAPDVINALRNIYGHDAREYELAKARFKEANPKVSMTSLDKIVIPSEKTKGQSHGSELLDLAKGNCELWHDLDKNSYATLNVSIDGHSHVEHWPISSRGFQEWLSRLAYMELGFAPSCELLKSASNALIGVAKYDGTEHKAYKRVAYHGQGYWIDLCDQSWRAILVTRDGYRIVDNPPVKFIRSQTMKPLPIPVAGGDLTELWALINIPVEYRILVEAWMIESFREDTPYVVLELVGEQGSAKSTTQRVLRELTDPNQALLRSAPGKIEDIFIAADNSHMISLENLSGLSTKLSDALCSVCTGGGTSSRTLYTNKEESVITLKNPIVLNGIGAVITRADLLDRAISITLPRIVNRKSEKELKAQLEEAMPRIMGALLNKFSNALDILPTIKIPSENLPRMADFAMLGEAITISYGLPDGEFLKIFKQNREDAIRGIIDSNPVALACIKFIESGGNHKGTVSNLLETLKQTVDSSQLEKGDYWPKSPKGLGTAIRRLAPALREIGIECSMEARPRRDGVHCILQKRQEATERVEIHV